MNLRMQLKVLLTVPQHARHIQPMSQSNLLTYKNSFHLDANIFGGESLFMWQLLNIKEKVQDANTLLVNMDSWEGWPRWKHPAVTRAYGKIDTVRKVDVRPDLSHLTRASGALKKHNRGAGAKGLEGWTWMSWTQKWSTSNNHRATAAPQTATATSHNSNPVHNRQDWKPSQHWYKDTPAFVLLPSSATHSTCPCNIDDTLISD